jgi:hypothetical protein
VSKLKEEKDSVDRESEFLFNNLKRFSKDIEGFPKDAVSFDNLPTEQMSNFADAAIIVMDKAIEKSESPEKFKERANIVKTRKKDLVGKKLKKDVMQGTQLVKLAYQKTNIDEKGLKIRNAATKKLDEATARLTKFNEESKADSSTIAPQYLNQKNKENITPNRDQKKKWSRSPVKFIQRLVNTMRGISPIQQVASTQQTNGKAKGQNSGKEISRY